eukprot:TRINITY_DN4525_c0_g1_i1.p1 TRINITY_DN4525_c0_g1~~TRINITY_DN4525_c0_g1_i1.p1  ORF type:complete len:2789 (-),score=1037.32 TRINITY_DN4525_c0_g1_i1:18-8384(-)
MSGIAVHLADTNYVDFPEIAKEIKDASQAVNGATAVMEKSLDTLIQSDDRRDGWNGLVDACRIMSGQTIKLLQVVYGADFKRLDATFNNFDKMIDDFDANKVESDPQGFADDASALASQGMTLANYLATKAADEESPFAREKMIKDAEELTKLSNSLIGAVNNSLQNIGDPEATREVKELVGQLKSTMDSANNTFQKSMDAEMIDFGKRAVEEHYTPDLSKHVEDDDMAPLLPAIRKAADLSELLKSANMEDIRELSGALKDSLDNIYEKAHVIAEEHPEKAKIIEDGIRNANKGFREQVIAAGQFVKNPDDPNMKKSLKAATVHMVNALGDLETITHYDIDDKLHDLQKQLNDIESNAKNNIDSDDFIPKLIELRNQLEDYGNKEAQSNQNLAQRKMLYDDTEKVVDSIDKLIEDIKTNNNNAIINDIADLRNKSNKYGDDFHLDPKKALKDVSDTMKLMNHAVDRDDMDEIEGFLEDSKNLAKIASDVTRRHAVKINNDPAQKKRLIDGANDLENKFDHIDDILEEYKNNPTDASKKNLKNAVQGIDDILDDIDISLKNVERSAPEMKPKYQYEVDNIKKIAEDLQEASINNPKVVGDIANNLKEHIDDLMDAVDVENQNNPQARAVLLGDIKRLKQTFPNQVLAAQNTMQNPTAANKKNLQNNTDLLKSILDEFNMDTSPTIEDNIQKVMVLAEKVKGSSAEDAEDILADLFETIENIKPFVKHAIAVNQNEDDAMNIKSAFDDMEDIADSLKNSVQDGSLHNIARDVDDFNNAAQLLSDRIAAHPLSAVDRVKKASAAVVTRAQNATMAEIEESFHNLDDAIEDMNNQIEDIAKSRDIDASQKQKMLHHINQIVDEANNLKNNANEVNRARKGTPEYNNAAKKLENNYDDIEKLLNNVSDSLYNKEVKFDEDIPHPGQNNDSPLHRDIKELKNYIDAVVDSAMKNPNSFADNANEVAKRINDIKEKGQQYAQDNPQVANDVIDNLNALITNYTPLIETAKSAVSEPNDVASKKALQDIGQNMKDVLDDLDAITQKRTLEAEANHLKDLLFDVVNAKKSGNNEEVEKLKDALDESFDRVRDVADYYSKINQDKNDRKNLRNAVNNMDDIMDDLSKDIDSNKSAQVIEDDSEKLLKLINDVQSKSLAKPLDALQNLSTYANMVDHAGKRGDSVVLNRVAGQEKDALDDLIDKSNKALASINNDARKNRILELQDTIKNLVPDQIEAARNTASDPSDANKGELDRTTKKLKAAIVDLDSELKNKKKQDNNEDSTLKNIIEEAKECIDIATDTAINHPHKADAAKNKALRKLDELDEKAKLIAEHIDDPGKQKHVFDVVDDLEKHRDVFDDAFDAAVNAPSDKTHSNLSEVAGQYKDILDDIENETKQPTLSENINEIKIVADTLLSNADQGKDLGDSIKHVQDLERRISEQVAKKINDNLDQDDKQQLEDDLEDFKKAVSDLLGDAHKNAGSDKLDSDLENLNKTANKILDNTGTEPVDIAKDIAVVSNIIKHSADRGDAPRFADASQRAVDDLKDLAGKTNEWAQNQDPGLANKVIEDIDNLQKKVVEEIQTGKEILRNPNDIGLKSKLGDIVEDIDSLVKRIEDNISNKDGQVEFDDMFFQDSSSTDESYSFDDSSIDIDESDEEHISAPELVSPIHKDLQKLKNTFDKIHESAKKGDPNDVAAQGKKAEREINDIKNAANDMAVRINDPMVIKDIEDSCNQLEKSLPQLVEASVNLLSNPANENALNELDYSLDAAHIAADNLEAATTPTLSDLLDTLKNVSSSANDAKKAGDDVDAKELNADVKELVKEIVHHGKYLAQGNNDVDDKQHMKDNLAEFNDVAKKFMDNIDGSGDHIDDDTQEMHQAIDKLYDSFNAGPLSKASRLADHSDLMVNAACIGDDKVAKRTGVKMLDDFDDLKDKIRRRASKIPGKEKELNDALDNVRNALQEEFKTCEDTLNDPTSNANKAALEDANDATKTALAELDAVLLNKHAEAPEKIDIDNKAAKLNKLLGKMDDLMKYCQENPDDRSAQKKLRKLVDKIHKLNEELDDSILDPSDRIVLKNLEIKDTLNKIKSGVIDDDPEITAQGLKLLPKNVDDYVEHLREAAADLDTDTQARTERKIREIEKLLPEVSKSCRDALRDQDNIHKKVNAADNIRKFKDALDSAENVVVPASDEKIIRDTANAIIDEMEKIKTNATEGNKADVEDGLKNISDWKDNLKRAGNRRYRQLPNDDNPVSELEKMWNKFGVKAQKLTDDPSNKELVDEFDEEKNHIEAGLEKLRTGTHADNVAAVQDVLDTMDDLEDCIKSGDAGDFADNARKLVNDINTVKQIIDDHEDSNIKEEANNAFEPVPNTHLKNILEAGKKCINDPSEDNKKDLHHSILEAKVPLADVIGALDKDSKDRDVNKAAVAVNASVAAMDKALRHGDGDDFESAVKRVIDDGSSLLDSAEKFVDPQNENLGDKLSGLENALNELKSANGQEDSQLKALAVLDVLDDLALNLDGVNGNFIADQAKANNIMAGLNLFGKNLGLDELLNNASDLADLLANLTSNAKVQARDIGKSGTTLTGAAQAALNLDDLLSNLENSASTPRDIGEVGDMGSLYSALSNLANPKPSTPRKVAEPVHVEENPETFEDMIDKVAHDIEVQMEAIDSEIQEGSDIAIELRKLAKFARDGERQSMIISGRTCAAQLMAFTKRIRITADAIPGANTRQKMEQDNLYRAIQALRNMGTQMKILTSVKAASVEDDKDTDETLMNITSNIGRLVTDSLTHCDTAEKTIIKR